MNEFYSNIPLPKTVHRTFPPRITLTIQNLLNLGINSDLSSMSSKPGRRRAGKGWRRTEQPWTTSEGTRPKTNRRVELSTIRVGLSRSQSKNAHFYEERTQCPRNSVSAPKFFVFFLFVPNHFFSYTRRSQ